MTIGDIRAKIPIIQGGMGVGVSLSGLASAVAEQGGIGVIAAAVIGYTESDFKTNYVEANTRALRREIRKARSKTSGILGVNVMVATTNYAEIVTAAVEEGIDIIFSGAGLPLALPKYANVPDGPKLVPIVSSGRAASVICKSWLHKHDRLPDAFVVEGPLAGGHLGFSKEQLDDPDFRLEKLVPEVIEAVKPFAEKAGKPIPVISAGGVYTGADIRKFLDLGAAGVQMGTRFVATHECDAAPEFKEAYVQANEEDVMIVKSPVGLPGRAIRNKFLKDVEHGEKKPFSCPFHCIKTCDYTKSPYCIAIALINARRGAVAKGLAFAGQNVHRIKSIISVKELIETLQREYEATFSAMTEAPVSAMA
jgi:nitronate monooxygenase